MKRAATAFLIFASAVFLQPGAGIAQTFGSASIAAPVMLTAEYHSGETVRYTFSQKMMLTTRVDPSVPSDQMASLTPRQYDIEGELVATFATTAPGEPLHGTVQFRGLSVKNWVSSAKVADLEASLRQLESASIALSTAADGNLKLAEMTARAPDNRFVLDVEDLYSLAQAVLISRIASEPLAAGQERESTDFPVPGLVRPGLNMTVRTEYVSNVAIANHPNAEIRLSMHVPNQSRPVASQANVSNTFERLYAIGDWTYLVDLGAHQISFLHKKVRTETGYSVESADSNEEIRIPRNLFTLEKQYEVTARRIEANAPPQREADLAAFEKSLAAPRRVEGSGTPASPGGEVPLGDVARRLRSEHGTPSQGQTETTPPPDK
jgi:hypothetical protein